MGQELNQLYEFGPFRLNAEERQLLREGELVPLTPKAFDLLLALLDQPGRLLEKELLLKAVWPDSFVEEKNLADNISRLRKTLGEGENGHKFIETIPKCGYRFVAEVRRQSESAVEPSAPKGAGEKQPAGSRSGSVAVQTNRIKATLRILALVIPIFIAVGTWLYFRLERKAEVDLLEFKGNFYLSKWKEDEVRKGIEYYNQAIALAPDSASPYEGLATAWIFLSDLYVSPREAMPRAKAAAVNALQRNQKSAQAHISMGVIKTQYEWDWAGAEQEFKRAIALAPNHSPAHQLYGWLLTGLGRFDEAQAEMKLALESEPLNDFGMWALGDSFYFARQYEQAIEQYRRAIGVEPNLHWTHLMFGQALEQQGKFTEAIAELKQAYRLNDNPQVLASLGQAYAVSGRRDEAQKVITELQETAKRRYVSPYDVATVYAGMGEKEQALAWLEKAYEDRSGWLALWLQVDPKFDGLRTDDRFRNLLRRVGHLL